MAKSKERNKAIQLRKQGLSIKEIAKKIGVSKSSASIWCRDIILTKVQIKKLHESMVKGSYAGRMRGATMQHENRMEAIRIADEAGKKEIGRLSKRDFLLVFIALYWGEGSKKKRELGINNSDPQMVKFIVVALKKTCGVKKQDFVFRVGINEIHKRRDQEVKRYWAEITGAPIEQFRRTSFIKVRNKKNYDNFETHYGTLTIKVKKSIGIYYRMMGLVKALSGGI